MESRVWGLVSLLLLALALPDAAVADALAGNRFPATDRTLYLSPETGTAGGQSGVLLLTEETPSTQGSQNFLAPGVDVLGVLQTPASQSWYTQATWDKDLEVVDDSVARLYFQANPQGLTVFEVRLYDIAPDGQANLIASDEQQFITLLGDPVSFPLHTTGVIVRQGHVLRLDVTAQTVNSLVILQYGGDTPSGVNHFLTRWLDTDGDGMPDSDEINAGRNPLNPNDLPDEGRDTDADGLVDRMEEGLGTDPDVVDTDGDGFGDGVEVFAGTDPLDPDSFPQDLNNNGLPDVFETTYFSNTTFNNSTQVNPTQGPCTPGPNCVDPRADPDGDGCDNLCEAAHGTDPLDPDTDGDGVPDGAEVDDGSDPKSFISNFYRGPRGVPEPVATAAFFALGSSLCLIALLRRH